MLAGEGLTATATDGYLDFLAAAVKFVTGLDDSDNVCSFAHFNTGRNVAFCARTQCELGGQRSGILVSEQADKHRTHFASLDKNTEFHEKLVLLAEQSLKQQSELEAQDTLSFDEYLIDYNNS